MAAAGDDAHRLTFHERTAFKERKSFDVVGNDNVLIGTLYGYAYNTIYSWTFEPSKECKALSVARLQKIVDFCEERGGLVTWKNPD